MRDSVAPGHAPAPAGAAESPVPPKAELRLWLRLLTCASMIEGEIRRRLRTRFDTTLPRFDVLAQLDKAPDGLTLGELSRRMMVSNGNVTGLVERLAGDGLVERRPSPRDGRATNVRLTPRGRAAFAGMADAHAGWIVEMLEGLSPPERDGLMALLAKTKRSVHSVVTEVDSQ